MLLAIAKVATDSLFDVFGFTYVDQFPLIVVEAIHAWLTR